MTEPTRPSWMPPPKSAEEIERERVSRCYRRLVRNLRLANEAKKKGRKAK